MGGLACRQRSACTGFGFTARPPMDFDFRGVLFFSSFLECSILEVSVRYRYIVSTVEGGRI